MTTIKAIRLASLVTAINVLVASGFSIAAIIRPQYLVPAESVPTEASLLLAKLLDAGIGLFQHDLGKFAGPLFIAVLQFFVVYLLHRSVRITPQTKRG